MNFQGYWLQKHNTWRLATCCMFLHPGAAHMNMGTTTRTTALADPRKALQKAIINVKRLRDQLNYVATFNPEMRYFRISSEILPCFTVPEIRTHYARIEEELSSLLTDAGKIAVNNGIRLSSHPDQFTVLGSNRSDVVKNSIENLHYHSQVFKWMNMPPEEIIINIHLQGLYGGKHIDGINRFVSGYQDLDDYTKKALTVENEDKPNGYDIVHTLELAQRIPIRCMFDIHHYYCYRKGEVTASHVDDEFKCAVRTWYPVRPAMHKSQSKLDSNRMNEHSDEFHDDALTAIAVPMLEYADIECEAKNKELAVLKFYEFIREEEVYAGEKLQLKRY